MQRVTQAKEIKELRNRKKPIILNFYTDWCGPCKLSHKMIEGQLTKYPGKLTIANINCDESEDLVLDYRVDVVPMMVLLSCDMSPVMVVKGYRIEKLENLFQKARQQQQTKK